MALESTLTGARIESAVDGLHHLLFVLSCSAEDAIRHLRARRVYVGMHVATRQGRRLSVGGITQPGWDVVQLNMYALCRAGNSEEKPLVITHCPLLNKNMDAVLRDGNSKVGSHKHFARHC